MRLHGKVLPSLISAVAALFIVAGCGSAAKAGGLSGGGTTATPTSSAGGGGSPKSTSVTIQNFAFTPQPLTVKAGTKVTWTNKDSVPHNVTSADSLSTSATTTSTFSSGNLGTGQTFSFTFTKAGTYFYECTIHAAAPSMHGKIVVT